MSIFCIVGYRRDIHFDPVHRQDPTRVVWPVCYRVERSDAEFALGVCRSQRDQFLVEISPVRDGLYEREHELKRLKPHRGARRIPRDQHLTSEHQLRAILNELRTKEAKIVADYTDRMLDPLFPTTGAIDEGDIEYKLIEFLDDPRELSAAELMKRRAELHGATDDDDDDERNDLDSPGWDT